jgi:hypothetical protein
MCLLALVLTGFGCSDDQGLAPTSSQVGDLSGMNVPAGRENAQPRYFTHYWTSRGVSFETIDVAHGIGVPFLQDVFLDDPSGKGYAVPLGLTFDLDGSVYIIVDWLFGADPYLAELFKVDLNTGSTTSIATFENHFCGSEIDACGNLYTVGFCPPNPPNDGAYFSPLYGDKLCRIDKYTGEVTPIGEGTGLVDIMDMAFDSHGTLWATTQNKLYTINLETGVAAWACDITNVGPPAPPGDPGRMVMSIAFDKHDVLWGTAVVGFCNVCDNLTGVMRINQVTGEGTLLGIDGVQGTNHGGDTMPSDVRIQHRTGNGHFHPMTVSIEALPAHLAHGDYVPGTDGHPCE